TCVGPCPLLVRLADRLRAEGASLAYLEACGTTALRDLAVHAVGALLVPDDDPALRDRVARGFAAAHRSYLRWESAVRGRNVPMTPRQFVLETIRRKARFAVGQHASVRLGDTVVDDLFRGGAASHEALLSHLAASDLVRPGAPDESRLITHSISLDGPMFN